MPVEPCDPVALFERDFFRNLLSFFRLALFLLPRTIGECTTQIVYVSDCVYNCVYQCESVCACTCVMAFTFVEMNYCVSSG